MARAAQSKSKQRAAPVNDRRKLQHSLVSELHRQRETPELRTLVAFCQLRLEAAKDLLLSASPETFSKLQGHATAYRDIMNVILLPPPEIQSEEK